MDQERMERTMQFILDQLADTTVKQAIAAERQVEYEKRQAEYEKRQVKADERSAKIDEQLARLTADVVTVSADIDKLKDEAYVARETMNAQTQAIQQLVKFSEQQGETTQQLAKLSERQGIENERIWKTLVNHKDSFDHTFDMIGQLTQQVDRLAATLDRHIRASFNGNQ